MNIIDSIDQATGCHQCGGGLGDSPSDLFCGEACQARWQAARVSGVRADFTRGFRSQLLIDLTDWLGRFDIPVFVVPVPDFELGDVVRIEGPDTVAGTYRFDGDHWVVADTGNEQSQGAELHGSDPT